jgi:signal transduction histidine kinase/DNA-binding response OmpR family regulator
MLGAGVATASMEGLCEHTISLLPPLADSEDPFLLEIPDLSQHPKYRNAGYVRNWPKARFYCGAPMRTSNGVSIGTVCVLDDKPRYGGLTEEQRLQMSTMADIFMKYLETKQGDGARQKSKLMETELSRFIAEGFLPGDGCTMAERRDGKLWSEKILEERRMKEMERKRRVDEQRQMFQERQFMEMVRREKEKEDERQNHGPPSPTTVVTTVRMDDWSFVKKETTVGETSGYMSRKGSTDTFWTAVEDESLLEDPNPPILIAHTRRTQPGIVETCHIVSGESAKVAPSLIETITRPFSQDLSPPEPTSVPTRPTREQPSRSNSMGNKSSFPYLSSSEASSDTDFNPSHSSRFASDTNLSAPSSTDSSRRRSNYEQTISFEPHFRAMFSRAATLVRNAIEADVVFLDGDLEGFFGPDEERLDGSSNGDDSWSFSHISTDLTSEAAARAQRPRSRRRQTGILGYATSGGSSNSRSQAGSRMHSVQDLGFDVSELSEESLNKIAEETIEGHIIAHVDKYPGLHEERTEYHATEQVLQRFLPGNKSVIIVPMFDHNRKLFAVCFAWTCSSTRAFTGDVEGSFVSAVVNSIMAEVTRLNILNADKAKGEFISSISHELRSPLHGILASADFLTESSLDPDQRSFMDTIICCGTTLLDTINHVLDFQKLNFLQDRKLITADVTTEEDSGRRTLDTTKEDTESECSEASSVLVSSSLVDIDLSSLIEDITEGVCLGFEFKGLSTPIIADGSFTRTNGEARTVIIDIDRRADGWVFNAHPAAIKRIINNIVSNALKYNTEDGWVHVSLRAEDLPQDSCGNNKYCIKLSVSDSGKGISREFLKTRLFTPFSQENPLSAGAGLGLSIVRQIVDMLEGKIDVKSRVGHGTTVTVEIPLVHVDVGLSDSVKLQKHTSEDEISTIRQKATGNKVRLVGFETYDKNISRPRQQAINFLRESVARYATEYFGLEVLSGITPGEDPADIIVANEMTEEVKQTINSLSYPSTLRRTPVIVMCKQPASQIFLGQDSSHITTIRKPCGPRKFVRALTYCFNHLANSTNTPPTNPLPIAPSFPVTPLSSTIGNTSSPNPFPSTSTALAPERPHNHPTSIPISILPIPSANTSPTSQKPRILAVEDNPINLLLLTTFLNRNRYPFDRATNGLEALQRVEAAAATGTDGYDVILMDLRLYPLSRPPFLFLLSRKNQRRSRKTNFNTHTKTIEMPILSGTESTREIRALEAREPEKYRRAFIVALTGLAAGNDRREAFEAGVDAFMVKPVKFRELEEVVEAR